MTNESKVPEMKVIAAAAASGLGGVISTLVVWWMGVQFWGSSASASAATEAMAAVPPQVSSVVVAFVSLFCAGAAGYLAPHTSRSVPSDEVSPTAEAPLEATQEPAEGPQSPEAS